MCRIPKGSYLPNTVRLLTRLISISTLAVMAMGCDMATNQTGGGWLSSQYGVRPPRLLQPLTVPVTFTKSQTVISLSPQQEVGVWKGADGVYDTASWLTGYALDSSAGVLTDTSKLDSLKLRVAFAKPSRSQGTWVDVRYGLVSDSATFANLFAAPKPNFVAFVTDSLLAGAADTGDTLSFAVPLAVRDSLKKRRSARLVVEFRAHGASEIVHIRSAFLSAGDSSSKLAYSKGILHAHSLASSLAVVQGGPVSWSLHLFPDRAALLSQLKSKGIDTSSGKIAVLDAELFLPVKGKARQDSVGQYVALASVVDTATVTKTLVFPQTAQIFLPVDLANTAKDTAFVKLDTAFRQGDSALVLRFYKYPSVLEDSLVLASVDTFWQTFTPTNLNYRVGVRRSGDSVSLHCKGVAAALASESQYNREGSLNASIYYGDQLGLAATRPFSALLNWSKNPEIILSPATTAGDATQWWYLEPDLTTATVRLNLLQLGGE